MSSSNGLFWDAWTSMRPYVIPPVAAATAIVPVFYGFIAKSAQQLGKPAPRMAPIEALKQGVKAAPTVGVIVGTQMVVQTIVENQLFGMNKRKAPSFLSMLASSIIVGIISAPALAVFNGQTMGRSIKASLQSLSGKQTMAIVTRETSFLFSLRISAPVSEAMKQSCGDSYVVDYGSTFMTGAIGSLIGHPADTALTLWQKNKRVMWKKHWNQKRKLACALRLLRGVPAKALAVGGFAMGYKWVKGSLGE